jgi:hypothetical protein
MALEIFISHSHDDRAIAEALVRFINLSVGIEMNEIRCTSFAPTALALGGNLNSELRRDMKRCQRFLPLITANIPASEFVSFEIGAAWVLDKPIMPLVYKMNANQKLPAILVDRVYTDLKLGELVRLGEELNQIYVKADQAPPLQILKGAQQFLKDVALR